MRAGGCCTRHKAHVGSGAGGDGSGERVERMGQVFVLSLTAALNPSPLAAVP